MLRGIRDTRTHYRTQRRADSRGAYEDRQARALRTDARTPLSVPMLNLLAEREQRSEGGRRREHSKKTKGNGKVTDEQRTSRMPQQEGRGSESDREQAAQHKKI